MTLHPIVDHSPHAMTKRARVYVYAGGLRHFFIGVSMLFAPWLYSAAAFIPIFNFLNQAIWAWMMVVVGAVCMAGAATRKVDIARAGMVGSAVVTLVLAVGLTLGLINVWWSFAQAMGTERLWLLFLDRPAVYPYELITVFAPPPSPFLALIMLSVSVKDFTMCAQPLRVPLEDRVEVARLRKA